MIEYMLLHIKVRDLCQDPKLFRLVSNSPRRVIKPAPVSNE
jgi:hypothetical protein